MEKMCIYRMETTGKIVILIYILENARLFRCEICSKQTITYEIGKKIAILDIPSEEISQLRVPCTKEVEIPDALIGAVYVDEAAFGGNVGFLAQANGMVQKRYEDTAIISNSCGNDPPRKNWSRQIKEGLRIYNITDSVCITFKPELNHRSLGYHVTGGRIKLSLTVTFAYCNPNNTNVLKGTTRERVRRAACRPICSVAGIVSSCEETTRFRQIITTTRRQASVTTTSHSKTSKQPMTYPDFVPFVHGNVAVPFTSGNSTIKLSSTQTTGHSQQLFRKTSLKTSVRNILITTKDVTNKIKTTSEPDTLTSSKVTKIPSSLYSTFLPNKPTIDVWKFETSEIHDAETTTKRPNMIGENSYWLTTQGTSEHGLTDQYPTMTRTDRPPLRGNSSRTFGLIEGLYVLVGCLVVFVVLFTFIYCVRIRNKSRRGIQSNNRETGLHRPALVSDSSYMSRWRDNWLIRYHNTENGEDDEPSVFEDNIDQMHGDSLRVSSNDLHNIHAHPIKDTNKGVTYHDPWPLIRLDSDFVRNTKSLERLPSNKGSDKDGRSTVKYVLTQKVSKASSDSGIGGKESVENGYSRVKHKSSSLKDKDDSGKERFRYIKRVNSHLRSRGSYNVSKAQRSASLSNYDFVGEHFGQSGNIKDKYTFQDQGQGKREHPYQEIPDIHSTDSKQIEHPKHSRRQRNTSSMCSESSITFEEMIREEILKCEESNIALDRKKLDENNTNGDGNENYDKDLIATKNAKDIKSYKIEEEANFRKTDATLGQYVGNENNIYDESPNGQSYFISPDKDLNDITAEKSASDPSSKGEAGDKSHLNTSIPKYKYISGVANGRLRQQEKRFSSIDTMQFPK